MLKNVVIVVLLGIVVFGAWYAYWPGAASGPVPVGDVTPVPNGEGWVDLLDATHAAQWKNVGDAKEIFDIKDGQLHVYGVTLSPLRYATYTGERFTDFDLHVEFKFVKGANSGLFVRAQPNDPIKRGFEIQVEDNFGQAPTKNSTGSVYDVVSPMFNMVKPAGEWNSFDVHVQGTQVEIVVNGWKVIDTDFAKMTTLLGKFKIPYATMQRDGNLAIQDHGGECWYRNFRVKKL